MLQKIIHITFILSILKLIVLAQRPKICPELDSHLKNGKTANVVVYFKGGVQPALHKASLLRLNDRKQNNQAIVDALKDHADESQHGVLNLLSARSGANGFKYFKQYWNNNKVFIKAANADTVYAVAQDPQVLKIKKEIMGKIPHEVESAQVDEPNISVRGDDYAHDGWHLAKIQAPEAWEELGGKKGEGVVVATIDDGVRHTHEQLNHNFVGIEYGWYDATEERSPVPTCATGHGTHTTAILAGNFTGVAPGVKWMTCKACNETYCPGEALLDCIKFMACPTLPDGSNPDCSKAPHIVSNSWVADRGSDDFNEDILRWRAMGIIPVWAVGNNGTECNQTMAPAEQKFVIGVGNTDVHDELYAASSAGWASDGGIKPDIVAPGTTVRSAWHWGDDNYRYKGGTSQACPVVAGVVALLKVRNPELTYDEAYDFLTQNTDPAKLMFKSSNYRFYCNSTDNPIDPRVYPNIFLGYGRVNAFKSVRAQTEVLNIKH